MPAGLENNQKGDTMNMKLKFLPALLLGLIAPAVLAQQPLISVNMTELDVISTGTIWGANPIYGTGGYNPVNGGNGPYTSQIDMWALATGTLPEGGYTYTFYVNGQSLGNAVNFAPGTPEPNTSPYPQGIAWTPPQPGVYYLSASATDGLTHTATSLPVEYFATGIEIVGPANNQIVPLGSSVIVEVAAAVNLGAVLRVDFYADGALIGSATNYPYSLIYTPSGPVGTVHNIYARSYNANGTLAFQSPTQGMVVVDPVLPVATCVISNPTGSPSNPAIQPIPDYAANANAFVPINVTASSPTGTIEQVQLFINGVLYKTLTAPPYTFQWTPQVTGTYTFVAVATDDKNNVIASTTSTAQTSTPAPTTVVLVNLPSVSITSPGNGATLNGGGPATLTATATPTNVLIPPNNTPVTITQVQFTVDGSVVGTATSPITPGGNTYSVSYTPVQNVDSTTGAVLPSTITAIATDSLGDSDSSTPISVSVTAGGSGGGSTVVGTPPTISISAPVNNTNVVVNTPVTINASAYAANGNVAQVTFLVDNQAVYTATSYPYSYSWTPKNLGFYAVTAQVVDNLGDKTNSSPININVVAETPPTVTITSPASGGLVTVGTLTTVSANASSATGTISQVQFFENGIAIGTSTTPPYTATFTPLSAGLYSLTAIATDNSGETTTSTASVIEATPSTSGVATTLYFGTYQGLTDGGKFAFAVVDGKYGVYIGHSSSQYKAAASLVTDLAVSTTGTFTGTTLTGTAASTGVSGNVVATGDLFIGSVPVPSTYAVASGYYQGNLGGQPNSQAAAIVGTDGEIIVYYSSGTYVDSGDDVVSATGSFTINTVGGNVVSGTVDPVTGFMSASVTGASGGTLILGRVSGGTFSDGVLHNLSTRGQVGTGANVMIAGFVVGGTSPKNVLIRATGPALGAYGVSGTVSATQLQIFSGSTLVASNTGWSSTASNQSAVTQADTQSGAFALTPGSGDSALVTTLAPGNYTAQVSGVGGATGVALVEAYDLDSYTPFTPNRLFNVSTRANVGTNQSVLIGGFSFGGTAPKRLLIRAAGPGLASFGVASPLSAPHLQLINTATQTVVRENYSWQLGNDAGLVNAAETASGAFAFASGSADSAILMTLPPGTYTAEVSGVSSATGVALVEVYEVP